MSPICLMLSSEFIRKFRIDGQKNKMKINQYLFYCKIVDTSQNISC